MRPSWDTTFMGIARTMAERGTCPRLRVGAVIVSPEDHLVLATGYNGAPPGFPHCDEVGCTLEGDHCVTGDTVISKLQSGDYNSGHRTIKEIHEMWTNPERHSKSGLRLMNVRAANATGMIVGDKITDVWKVGTSPVYCVTSKLGRTITTTLEHRFLTPEGWIALGSLSPGDRIALNGQPLWEDASWLRRQYQDEGKSQVDIAEIAGCSRKTIERRLDRFGIERRPFHFGGWNRGLHGEGMPRYKEFGISRNRGRERSRRYALQESCDVCGSRETLQVHHLDEDPTNTSLDNLMTLCLGCHTVAHTPHAKRTSILFDTIVSIESGGEQEVFDLTTEKYHNFVGNGFVVHNCIRAVHAETNAITSAAKHGIRINQAVLYCLYLPCSRCANMIKTAGISEVVYQLGYKDSGLEHLGITVRRYAPENDPGGVFYGRRKFDLERS